MYTDTIKDTSYLNGYASENWEQKIIMTVNSHTNWELSITSQPVILIPFFQHCTNMRTCHTIICSCASSGGHSLVVGRSPGPGHKNYTLLDKTNYCTSHWTLNLTDVPIAVFADMLLVQPDLSIQLQWRRRQVCFCPRSVVLGLGVLSSETSPS